MDIVYVLMSHGLRSKVIAVFDSNELAVFYAKTHNVQSWEILERQLYTEA